MTQLLSQVTTLGGDPGVPSNKEMARLSCSINP